MHYLTVILRLLHVVSGAFWFGSSMMLSFFISPTVAATADAGQRFMGHLVKQRRVVTVKHWSRLRAGRCIGIDRVYLRHANRNQYQQDR